MFRKPIEKIFATEEIAKAVIALGFNEQCIGKHAGFKLFGEGDDKLRNKFVFTSVHKSWSFVERDENMPMFPICDAPTWEQVIDWLRDTHDIDLDFIRVRNSEFQYEYSVMVGGKLIGNDRVVSRREAVEKAILMAIAAITELKDKQNKDGRD